MSLSQLKSRVIELKMNQATTSTRDMRLALCDILLELITEIDSDAHNDADDVVKDIVQPPDILRGDDTRRMPYNGR